jgi:hypothetical protein
MDAISGEIRLAHDRDFRAIGLLSEWLVDLGHNLVVYRPQGLGFAVRNTGTAATEVPPTDYTARLVHICDGGKTPDRELLDRLGKDGRICLTNNAAERALRGIALGRKSWLFCGSDRGGHRAATMYSLIVTAKMNDIDPQAWLADVLARIAEHPAQRIDELLPWNWKSPTATVKKVA